MWNEFTTDSKPRKASVYDRFHLKGIGLYVNFELVHINDGEMKRKNTGPSPCLQSPSPSLALERPDNRNVAKAQHNR